MGGTCCGCIDVMGTNPKDMYSPIATAESQDAGKSKAQQKAGQSYQQSGLTEQKETPSASPPRGNDKDPFLHQQQPAETKQADDREQDEDWLEYKKMMQLTFYAFAGYQPWAKKIGLYMHQKELQRFLEIVNIDDPVEEVFKVIDATDVEDGKLTFNEWMDYFTNKEINPGVDEIRDFIEDQTSWALLVKALKIFETMDADHSGKLEYNEFIEFGKLIGLDEEETEVLWNRMDTNQSGAIDIVELFEWFRMRLYQQRSRIASQKQASIMFNQEETAELEQFRKSRQANADQEA
mmetsp:Transcript_44591/g.71368  ORF Transcript_44591/g.71368 Transcript_44591/m.71368 type:complete len:293 (-) Transcript_44591:50-928(-)|eukprot:CAMPEP_0197026018 /NCGR_PEP_ID=MMETSP1384-20130603/6204_1 /TAXON_ID=29189 /ORGANISM="Ammonia sp." /LENGTH=292 /DNA_ID=CAMNT_0042454619 /DNA_START=38 /DNA_END=916 /DNA_ORIENTATION=-